MDKSSRKILLVSLLLIIALVVSGCSLLDSGKYKKAVEHFEQSNYAEAQAIFAEISAYEDSDKYLKYIDATQKADNSDYADAATAFADLADFRDSHTLSVYYSARQAETEERYEDADALYQQVTAYSDSAERLAVLPELIKVRDEKRRVANYEEAQKLLNAGSYEDAIAIFTELNGYEESSKFLMYARAMQLAEDGGYELAVNSFISLDDFRDSKLQVTYYQARWAEAEQRYEDATELYKTIATFRDSANRLMAQPDLILDRDFSVIQQIMRGEREDDGSLTYEDVVQLCRARYSDSETRMHEQFYAFAEEMLSQNHFDPAYQLFSILNEQVYSDSAVRMQDVRFAWAQSEMSLGEYKSALYELDPLMDEGYAAAVEPRNECYYQLALEAENELDYASAHSYFGLAGEHKDSAEKAKRFENEYVAAEALFAEAKYTEALSAFAALHNYSDAASRIPEVHYKHAEDLLAAGEWESASVAFANAGEYSNASDRINEPYYKQGEALLAEEKYDEAITAFSKAVGYSNAGERIQMIHYTLAEKALAAGEYDTASTEFTAAGAYSDASSRIKEPFYVKAEKLLAEGKTAEAIAEFTAISDYSDAATRVKMIHYTLAENALDASEYDEALAQFAAADNYSDAETRLRALHYDLGEAAWAESKLEKAVFHFRAAGTYSNAFERMKETLYQQVLSLAQTREYAAAIDVYQSLSDVQEQQGSVEFIRMSDQIYSVGTFDHGIATIQMYNAKSIYADYGAIDETGKLLFTTQSRVTDFYDGFATWRSGSKTGYLNSKGKVVFSDSNTTLLEKCTEGVGYNNEYYINLHTGETFSFGKNYYVWRSFSEGLVCAKDKNEKIGFGDINGNWVIEPAYTTYSDFHNGYAIVTKDKGSENRQFIVINRHGETVLTIPREYAHSGAYNLMAGEGFFDGLLLISDGEKYGYMDIEGNIPIDIIYQKAGEFSNGLAWVEIDGKKGFINTQGEQVIPCLWDNCSSFMPCGLAVVESGGQKGLIDRNGNMIIKLGEYQFSNSDSNVIPMKTEEGWLLAIYSET